MAAVVNRTTRFGRVVNGTKILPLRCTHLRACLRRAGRLVSEESDYDRIGFLCQKTAQLKKPKMLVNTFWRFCKLHGHATVKRSSDGGLTRMCKGEVKGFEMLCQLECGVNLHLISPIPA